MNKFTVSLNRKTRFFRVSALGFYIAASFKECRRACFSLGFSHTWMRNGELLASTMVRFGCSNVQTAVTAYLSVWKPQTKFTRSWGFHIGSGYYAGAEWIANGFIAACAVGKLASTAFTQRWVIGPEAKAVVAEAKAAVAA